MKVLIACEESQEVCKAFRAKGHEAYSLTKRFLKLNLTLRLDFSEKVTRQTYALAIFICAKLSEIFLTPLNF